MTTHPAKTTPDLTHEDHHVVALARELTAAAGIPLRDRYGYAASDQDVLGVLHCVRVCYHDDAAAADAIGMANALGDLQLCQGYDTPIDQAQELLIAQALQPLIKQRRDAAAGHGRPR